MSDRETPDEFKGVGEFVKNWKAPNENGDPHYRGLKIVLTAISGLVLAFPVLHAVMWFGCQAGLNMTQQFLSKPPWHIISAMATAPVLVLLWYWRDGLRRGELVEKRRTNDIADRDSNFRISEANRTAEEAASNRVRETRKRMGLDGQSAEATTDVFEDLRSVILGSANPEELKPLYASISSAVHGNRELADRAMALLGSKLVDADEDEARLLTYYLRDIKHDLRGQREGAQQDLNVLVAKSHPTEQDLAKAKASAGRFAKINRIDPYFADDDVGFLTAWLVDSKSSNLGQEVSRIVKETIDELKGFHSKAQARPPRSGGTE